MNPFHLNGLTTTELLRVVDRTNPEVKALAERLEKILELTDDVVFQDQPVDKESHDVFHTA